jgi:transcriptional regulator with XRE-family HTH domain
MKFNNMVGPQIRKLRASLGWSQEKFAVRLQCAGWDVTRSTVSKIESRSKCVTDFEMEYVMDVLGVERNQLFPVRNTKEAAHDYLTRVMNSRF